MRRSAARKAPASFLLRLASRPRPRGGVHRERRVRSRDRARPVPLRQHEHNPAVPRRRHLISNPEGEQWLRRPLERVLFRSDPHLTIQDPELDDDGNRVGCNGRWGHDQRHEHETTGPSRYGRPASDSQTIALLGSPHAIDGHEAAVPHRVGTETHHRQRAGRRPPHPVWCIALSALSRSAP